MHLSPLDGEIALSTSSPTIRRAHHRHQNLSALLPTALKLLGKGLLDRLIVCEDDDWGEIGTPQGPAANIPAIITYRQFVGGFKQAGRLACHRRG